MKNRTLYPLIVLVILGLLLAACQPAKGGEGTASVTEGGSEDTSAPPPTEAVMPEAVIVPDMITGEVTPYVYETLFDADGEPVLASGVIVSEDGLDYIIALRTDVDFHNGNPFNADAVIANFNRWFDPNDPIRGSGSFEAWAKAFGGFKDEVDEDGKPKSIYDGIEKVDESTVLVHLNTPDQDFLRKLSDTAFVIISPDALAAGSNDGGTGPYKVGEATGSTVKLEPFEGYWDSSAIPASGMEVNRE